MQEAAKDVYLFANILVARSPSSNVVNSQLALRGCHHSAHPLATLFFSKCLRQNMAGNDLPTPWSVSNVFEGEKDEQRITAITGLSC